jgi:hypothetical protein
VDRVVFVDSRNDANYFCRHRIGGWNKLQQRPFSLGEEGRERCSMLSTVHTESCASMRPRSSHLPQSKADLVTYKSEGGASFLKHVRAYGKGSCICYYHHIGRGFRKAWSREHGKHHKGVLHDQYKYNQRLQYQPRFEHSVISC